MEPEFEISVVIPVYRVEAFLHDCVESVLVQTFREFEIVLVDDGSPDRCPAICDDYAARYADPTKGPVIRVVHKKNAGLGMARNTGMDAARGRYITFLDSDDMLHPRTLERLHEVAVRTGSQVVHARHCKFVTPGTYSAEVHTDREHVISGADAMRRVALCSFASYPGDEPYTLEGAAWGRFSISPSSGGRACVSRASVSTSARTTSSTMSSRFGPIRWRSCRTLFTATG